MSYNLQNKRDNAGTWMAQYRDQLLPKNFTGISIVWDEQYPPVTRGILPFKQTKFNFTQRIKIDPLIMAPEVQEGGKTPLTDREYIIQKYVCTPYKLGGLLTEQMIENGIDDAMVDVTSEVVDAVNLSITYDNVNKLQGVGVEDNRALSRLNTAIAGKPAGVGTATPWSDTDADILKDITSMRKRIRKASGKVARAILVPPDEYESIQNNEGIIEQLKYVTPDFLSNGEIPMIKGIMILEMETVYKDKNKRAESDEKIPMLENKVIMVADDVGYTAYAQGAPNPITQRIMDLDRDAVMVKAKANSTTVIKDFGRIGIISGTNVA